MPVCLNCGVEPEKNMNFCPLCGEPVKDESADFSEYIRIKRKKKEEEENLTDYQQLTRKGKRKLFWKIVGIILLTGIFVTLLVDLIANHAVTWSRYTITFSAIVFAMISVIVFWHKKLFLLFAGNVVLLSVFLILTDLYSGSIGWSLHLGIPLLIAGWVIAIVLVQLIRHTKKRGFNILAYCFLALGVLSVCTEGILSHYKTNVLHLEWSLIVVVSVLSVALVLFYLHFKMKKGTNLNRFFHI